MIWENVHVLWMIRGKGTCALDDKGRYNNRVEKTKQHKLTEDGHVVGRLAAVLALLSSSAATEWSTRCPFLYQMMAASGLPP